jgi:hypothetical protein
MGILQLAIDKIVEAEKQADAELEAYYRSENDHGIGVGHDE